MNKYSESNKPVRPCTNPDCVLVVQCPVCGRSASNIRKAILKEELALLKDTIRLHEQGVRHCDDRIDVILAEMDVITEKEWAEGRDGDTAYWERMKKAGVR